jgi:hypothetical protein
MDFNVLLDDTLENGNMKVIFIPYQNNVLHKIHFAFLLCNGISMHDVSIYHFVKCFCAFHHFFIAQKGKEGGEVCNSSFCLMNTTVR